ncbi:MAG: type I 3-dehydroquinate dehydratase [Natronomonas sp.]|uniref:type I 3-dehydroquinate dehydratase n=1 Tax=Natronomonas sp. TaxID=2184060 RepID=UPI00286FC04A|nr:type I 3-dehydroquinate dehydratase [Natronomonas sp.]MDR9431885.1 type I 3-dehydroquinate dehydratase [Natronomonas sp.]
MTDESLEATVATIKRAGYAGTSALEVYLPLLDFLERAVLRELTATTAAPIYATCRRSGFYELLRVDETPGLTDEQRVDALVDAVKARFYGEDSELDTFDPTGSPERLTTEVITEYAADPNTERAQVTDRESPVERQREAIDRVHEVGGEATVSAHTYTHLEPEDAVTIAERVTDRNADFLKIVGVDSDINKALDTIEAHLRLNERDTVPHALMAIGDPSRIVRPLSPMFGSAWVFAQPAITPGGFHSWPLVENAREILRRTDWRTAHDPTSTDFRPLIAQFA